MHLVASLKATWTPRSPPIQLLPKSTKVPPNSSNCCIRCIVICITIHKNSGRSSFSIANCSEERVEFCIDRNGIVKLSAVFMCSSRFASSKHRHWFEASSSWGGSFAFEIRWSAWKDSSCRKECDAGGSHGRCALGQAWHRFSELQDRVARNYPHFYFILHKFLFLLLPTRMFWPSWWAILGHVVVLVFAFSWMPWLLGKILEVLRIWWGDSRQQQPPFKQWM